MSVRMSHVSLHVLILLGLISPATGWSTAPQAPTGAAAGTTTPAGDDAAARPRSLGELRAGMIELRARAQAAPKDPEVRYDLGVVYLDLGEEASAEQQLRMAIELGAAEDKVWPKLAQALLRQGEYARVLKDLPISTLEGSEAKAAVAVARGLASLGLGQPDEAREQFREALGLEPDYSPAYVGLARTSLAQEELPAARDALTSAAAARLADPLEVAQLRGDIALAAGDFAAAQASYQRLADARPDQPWRLIPLAEAQIAQGQLDAADATLARLRAAAKPNQTVLYLEGMSALQRGDDQRALDTLAPVLAGTVGEPRVLLVAGTAAFRLGHDEQAGELIERFIKIAPDNVDGRRLAATLLIKRGEANKALEYALPLAQGPAPSAADLRLAGLATALAGDQAAGLRYLEKAHAMQPDDQDLRRLVAAAKADAGDTRDLEKLVAEGAPELDRLGLNLLQAALRKGDYVNLLTAARRYQKEHPTQPEGFLYEGVALVRTGNAKGAAAAFQRVLDLRPNHVDALTGLADVRLSAGDPQGARVAITEALKVSPNNPALLDNLIAIGIAEGQPDKSPEVIRPLVAAAPGDQALAVALARALSAAGQPLAALEFLSTRPDAAAPLLLREQGQAQRRAGRTPQALATLRQVAETAPNSLQARIDLARATQESGDPQAAARLWDQAAQLEPANGEVRVGQANAALLGLSAPLDQATVKRVVEQAAKVVRENPRAPGAEALQATVMILLQQPKVAAEHLEPVYAATLEPLDLLLLSRAYLNAKDQARSLEVLRKHVERFPGEVLVRMELARQYAANDQLAAAAVQLKELVAHDWGNGEAQLQLARILVKTGHQGDAAPHLAAAAATLAGDERVKEMQALVKQSPPAAGTATGQ